MSAAELDQVFATLRRQIEHDQLLEALQSLKAYLLQNVPLAADGVSTLERQWRAVQKERRLGLVTREEARVAETRIAAAIFGELREQAAQQQTVLVAAPTLELASVAPPTQGTLEMLRGFNNLRDVAWLELGVQAARAVCCLYTPSGKGTGFLVAPDLLLTNNHVLTNPESADVTLAEFNFQNAHGTRPPLTARYRLDTQRCFRTWPRLDYTLVGVQPQVANDSAAAPAPDSPALSSWGWLRLNPDAQPQVGEHVMIIGHPNGGPKQVVLTANQVRGVQGVMLHYTTDTMKGSSGSPVFNDRWEVVALHHAGEITKPLGTEGYYANEGILVSAIRQNLGEDWPRPV